MSAQPHRGLSRRTFAGGAAWTLPAVSFATLAPATSTSAAAQGVQEVIRRARFTVDWGPVQDAEFTNVKTFTATNSDGTSPQITLSVTINSSVTSGQPTRENLTVSTIGRGGADRPQRFAETPLLVLNQTGSADVVPRQQLQVTVRDSLGAPVSTRNALVRVHDLTSNSLTQTGTPSGLDRHWDAIRFPDNPDTTSTGVARFRAPWDGANLNVTCGTGPYYPASPDSPTPTLAGTHGYHHVFNIPSGLPPSIVYTQHGNLFGTQFIGISQISFDAEI